MSYYEPRHVASRRGVYVRWDAEHGERPAVMNCNWTRATSPPHRGIYMRPCRQLLASTDTVGSHISLGYRYGRLGLAPRIFRLLRSQPLSRLQDSRRVDPSQNASQPPQGLKYSRSLILASSLSNASWCTPSGFGSAMPELTDTTALATMGTTTRNEATVVKSTVDALPEAPLSPSILLYETKMLTSLAPRGPVSIRSARPSSPFRIFPDAFSRTCDGRPSSLLSYPYPPWKGRSMMQALLTT
ncbi:hypothetical protein C8Q70DRAFT_272945 [Cubamyces menziesii]|nr:hypothetical protein C8Q70DRAFT_272945 [Cubamyces menziesii]